MPLPVLTDRLELRWPIESDYAALCTLWTDPRVARFMDDYGPRDPAAVRDWLDTHANNPGDGTHLQLIITRRSDAEVLGWLGLGASDDPLAAWSFGYAVLPSHRSYGYATEALKAALAHCHGDRDIPSLWGECHPTNAASAHVMQSAGMQETTPAPNTSRRFIHPPTQQATPPNR
ncbi:GNAT family N-acetyltransferase [Kribbella sp. NBC_00709]|uniref:GNAT family N-acetyltransferase n=1 Tax=Kribbella sp. NBC_00709 TaxID=2975972 RepID=UPI002E290B28|nr:GNAT family N-acetyltransferase [Kribbella sp. NBC_00709]